MRVSDKGKPVMCKRTLARKLKRAERFIEEAEAYLIAPDSKDLEQAADALRAMRALADWFRSGLKFGQVGRPRKVWPGGLLAQAGPPAKPKVSAGTGKDWERAVYDQVEAARDRLNAPIGKRAGISEAIRHLLVYTLAPSKGWSADRALEEFDKTRSAYKRGGKIRR